MASAIPKLTVLSRAQCHLCEDMALQLEALRGTHAFEFEVADIDCVPALMERYGHRIPVLVAGDEEICSTRLDLTALHVFLERYRSTVD